MYRFWPPLIVVFFMIGAPISSRGESSPEPKLPVSPGPIIVPLTENTPAPYTGLLVPEQRYVEFLEAELARNNFQVTLNVKKKETQALEKMYQERLRETNKPQPWYSTPSFNRWLGFGLGVAVTTLAIWGSTSLAEL